MRLLRILALACVFGASAFGQSVAAIAPMPKWQPLDLTGVTLPSGRLCTYAAGTSTPLATYTDSTGNTANSNPVVLDSAGRADVWIKGDSYKFVLRSVTATNCSTGSIIWTVDNVSDPAEVLRAALANTSDSTLGDALIGMKAAGGSALARTVHDVMGELRFVSNYVGATLGAKLTACLAGLPASGGICDAGMIAGAQSITSTVTLAANQQVTLGNVVVTCTVKCFSIPAGATGAKIIGRFGGAQSATAALQTGTVLRASGYTGTTDMITVGGTSTSTDSVEISNLTLDFANVSANTGRYGIATYGLSNSVFRSDSVWNAGSDCWHFEPTDNHSYTVLLDQPEARSCGRDGFQWTTANGVADFDRWMLINPRYVGLNPGDPATRFGTNGFHLITPAASIADQQISDFTFINPNSNTTVDGGNGFFMAQDGNGRIVNIFIVNGLFEDSVGANTGYGIKATSTLTGGIYGIHINYAAANYSAGDNVTTSNTVDYCVSLDSVNSGGAQAGIGLKCDIFRVPERVTVTGGSAGTVQFTSLTGGVVSVGIKSDGIVTARRDDLNVDYLQLFNPANISPAGDSSGPMIAPVTTLVGTVGDSFHVWKRAWVQDLNVEGGVTNRSGMQHERLAAASTCTTAAAVGAVCSFNLTWDVSFGNTSYTPVCSVKGTSGVPVISSVAPTATDVGVTIAALTAAAATGDVACIAMHDPL